MNQKIKLTGQLITDDKPVILAIEDDFKKIDEIAKEYQKVFPDIFLNAEWGYFRKIVSKEKAKALANLLSILNAPLQRVFASF